MVDSRDAFVAGCASTADVDFSGSIIPEPEYGYSDIIELGTPIGLPGGNTLTFNVRMWVREVGLTWFTWDGRSATNAWYIIRNRHLLGRRGSGLRDGCGG